MVEFVASMTVMVIGIVGVIGVMNSSFRVAGAAGSRFKAASIATAALESLRGKAYDEIVVPADDSTEQWNTKIGGATYRVERAVRWVKENGGAATGVDGHYKQATVSVGWTDESGYHEVHQTTIVYPGGLGPQNAGGSVNPIESGDPAAPTNLIATIPTELDSATGVDLTWTPPAVSSPEVVAYVIQYSRDASFAPGAYSEITTSQPGETPALRVTDLAANTTYHFRIASQADNGNLSPTWATAFNVQTAISTSLVCSVGLATVTPSAVTKKNAAESSGLDEVPTVTVNTVGVCLATTFRLEYSPRPGATDSLSMSDSGGIWTTALVANQAWTVGEHEVNVYDNLNAKRATMILLVCAHTAKVCV